MTIPGGTTRASQPKALGKDKHTKDARGENRMQKDGAGAHNWGDADHELEDELAAQKDAERDAEEAIAEGDEHPGVQSFGARAGLDTAQATDTGGSLSDDYAAKEGGLLARSGGIDPHTTDLNEIARTSGSVSHPTGDSVSSGAQQSLEQSVDTIGRSKGTEGGFGGGIDQEIVRDATTSATA